MTDRSARKILYVHHNPEISGSTLSLLSLVEFLDRTQFVPTVLFHGGDGPATELFRNAGVRTIVRSDISFYAHGEAAHFSFRAERPWRPMTELFRIVPSALRLARMLRAERFDLVHLNSSLELPAALGARMAGVPIVWHVRERLRRGTFGLRRAVVRVAVNRLASRAIAISAYEAGALTPSRTVRVIHNFVDFARFDRNIPTARARQLTGLPGDAPTVVMLGGTLPHKGALLLIDAASILAREFPAIRIVVIGCRPRGVSPSALRRRVRTVIEGALALRDYGALMTDRIRRLGLEQTVSLFGVRTDIPELLAAADVLAFPATKAHFARPVVEASAMARPAVATRIGGAAEFIVDGVTGLLVPPNDPAALAEGIASLLRDPGRARAMGEAAFARARELFDAARNTHAIMDVYREVLGVPGGVTARTAAA